MDTEVVLHPEPHKVQLEDDKYGKCTLEKDGIKRGYGLNDKASYFEVPETTDLVVRLFSPEMKKFIFEWLTLGSIGLYIFLFLLGFIPKKVTLGMFIYWRLVYNLGLGYILRKQSSSGEMIKWAKRCGFEKLDKGQKRSCIVNFFVEQIRVSMSTKGQVYDYDSVPIEFNTWLLYRGLVDLILINDFTSYVVFSISYFEWPENGPSLVDYLGYVSGIALLLLNLWVKTDAHRVIKDYAWYWGDFFFKIEDTLNFDGVFQLVPHPMYSIGYIGFYGTSLITKSYYVLFVSLFAHAGQLLFLALVESPHMEKIYGSSVQSRDPELVAGEMEYFGTDKPSLWKPNLMNASTFVSTLFHIYTILTALFITPRNNTAKYLFFAGQSLFWFTLRTIGCGFILWKQAKSRSWMKYFSIRGIGEHSSFRYWVVLYDLVHAQSYIWFVICCWKFMGVNQARHSNTFITRIVFGTILGILQLWMTFTSLNDVGLSGWYYGDFFTDRLKSSRGPVYTGLYRYVDDPMLCVTFLWGMALISNSWVNYAILVYAQLCLWGLVHYVEKPYLKYIYSGMVRDKGGAERVILHEIDKIQAHTKRALDIIIRELELSEHFSSIRSKVRYPKGELKRALSSNAETPRELLVKIKNDLSMQKKRLKEMKNQIRREISRFFNKEDIIKQMKDSSKSPIKDPDTRLLQNIEEERDLVFPESDGQSSGSECSLTCSKGDKSIHLESLRSRKVETWY